ncbi:MAG: tRNA (adenosine(37)-N6)-threonylcarbamoyltransferase complex transferase subunit TsaD [Oligosphaeraceae bacterium]|nr:tRNA (adenosine(37)-N6)-threonylcarbamoyltransferase complex transferase subunit TsaD [Oligosphaeraceae bacterium]
MIILGIESSCDETAAAVVRAGHHVLGSVVASQVKLHAGYGGVIPELAAREHLRNITPVVAEALTQAGLGIDAVSAVAVTSLPGLIPALLVGNAYAKGLAVCRGVPLLGINHFEAHIYGAFLEHPELLADSANFPVLALVVSGGHTALVLIAADGRAEILGATLDDAAGEALDKAAKILGLGYPGGPVIDRIAKGGDPHAFDFPQGLRGSGGRPVPPGLRFSFSFSGVKTALLYAVRGQQLGSQELADVVASYQRAVMEVLVSKTMLAAQETGARLLCLCGGVACNSYLRGRMREAAAGIGRQLLLAEPKYCGDNAAMVAGLGWHYARRGITDGLSLPVAARLPARLGSFPFAPAFAKE